MRSYRPFARSYQRAAIAAAYANRWRPADPADLAPFVAGVNRHLSDEMTPDGEEVKWDERRRTIRFIAPNFDYRATIREGVRPWASGAPPLLAADIERLERRPA